MRWARKGATTVESMVVLATLFAVLFVVFDLGLAVFRYNVLGASARRVAREAIVHGKSAPPERSAWGPGRYQGTAADDHPAAILAASLLPTLSAADVTIEVEWPDADNRESDRVRVRLAYVHHPLVALLSINSALNLNAESTMQIVH